MKNTNPDQTPKPALSFTQIINMCLGFLGIQCGFALQAGNASRILQTFGADVEHLTWFWLAAPLTGLLIQPVIGHYSDRTWTGLGRRTPYYLTGAVLSACALFFMPNSALLAAAVPPVIIGAGILMLMDASFNVAMEPFRALVADNLPEDQHNQGFSVQTALIGFGAILGSLLPYIMTDWFHAAKTAPEGIVPQNLKVSFYTGAAILLATVLWTVFRTKEYSPEAYVKFHPEMATEAAAGRKRGFSGEMLFHFRSIPKTMKQLAVVQFFTWFAFFSMWVFTTPAIAQHIYHLPEHDTSSVTYNNAANQVGILFGVYNGVSAVYAVILPKLIRFFNRKLMHAFSLLMGGAGLISLYFIKEPGMLYFPMIGIGLAWGSALAIPYAILSKSIPASAIGVYMGIFNFTITVPQILNGIVGGMIMEHFFNNKPIYSLVMAGIFLLLAAVSVSFVNDEKEAELNKQHQNIL